MPNLGTPQPSLEVDSKSLKYCSMTTPNTLAMNRGIIEQIRDLNQQNTTHEEFILNSLRLVAGQTSLATGGIFDTAAPEGTIVNPEERTILPGNIVVFMGRRLLNNPGPGELLRWSEPETMHSGVVISTAHFGALRYSFFLYLDRLRTGQYRVQQGEILIRPGAASNDGPNLVVTCDDFGKLRGFSSFEVRRVF